MSWLSAIGSLLNGALKGASAVASVSKSIGIATVAVGSTKIPLASLTAELEVLSKANLGSALVASGDFTDLKSFLESSQLEDDLIDVSDVLSLIGLLNPGVAAAASDLRAVAMSLTVLRKGILEAQALGLFTNLIPDGHGGFVNQAWIDNPRMKLDKDGNFIEN